jgi:hypothetical protein
MRLERTGGRAATETLLHTPTKVRGLPAGLQGGHAYVAQVIGDMAITQWTMSEVQSELLDIHRVPKKDGVYGLDPL